MAGPGLAFPQELLDLLRVVPAGALALPPPPAALCASERPGSRFPRELLVVLCPSHHLNVRLHSFSPWKKPALLQPVTALTARLLNSFFLFP